MLNENLIKEAEALRMQMQSGTIVVPAIINFLQKVGRNTPPKSKKPTKQDLINQQLQLLDKRKRPARNL